MKPPGTTRNINQVPTSSSANTARITLRQRATSATRNAYECETRSNKRLNAAKGLPSTRSMSRWNRSAGTCFGRSSNAASAGDSVNELNVEMIVEAAIVTANWR
jgi:hypothetical protein